MFPQRERLKRAEFAKALSGGRRVSSLHFTVVAPEKERGYAVVVPKKVANLSVTRHIIKRKVMAALRTVNMPKALIVFPKSSVSSVSYQDMKKELAMLISKIKNP